MKNSSSITPSLLTFKNENINNPKRIVNIFNNCFMGEKIQAKIKYSHKNYTGYLTKSKVKTAKVIPIHKKESKLDYTNYRPISLLSNLDRISEKLMHNRLYKFLNDNDIIYPLQFGFRQKYSTSFAFVHLTEIIKEALDQEKYGCGIFVDLQKAFDTADHNILIGKLKHYGITYVQLIVGLSHT